LFARCAEFFTTFVNPIGLANISWRYFITYCCFLAFEVFFIYHFFPETFGKTLEEASFRKSRSPWSMKVIHCISNNCLILVFEEDKPFAEKTMIAVENSIAHEMTAGGPMGITAEEVEKKA